jgi:hypothetical protein
MGLDCHPAGWMGCRLALEFAGEMPGSDQEMDRRRPFDNHLRSLDPRGMASQRVAAGLAPAGAAGALRSGSSSSAGIAPETRLPLGNISVGVLEM